MGLSHSKDDVGLKRPGVPNCRLVLTFHGYPRSWWVGHQGLRHSFCLSHPILVTSQLIMTKDFVTKAGKDIWQLVFTSLPSQASFPMPNIRFSLAFSPLPIPNWSVLLFLVEKRAVNSPAGGTLLELTSWKPSRPVFESLIRPH